MRNIHRAVLITLAGGLAVAGLVVLALWWMVVQVLHPNPRSRFEKVVAFNGRLLHNGAPVAFAVDETPLFDVFLQPNDRYRFGIPLKSDGSFQIAWMPVGKYRATLIRDKSDTAGKWTRAAHVLPDFEIEEGKTEYTIELGKDFKP